MIATLGLLKRNKPMTVVKVIEVISEGKTIEEAIQIAKDRAPMAIIANGGDNEQENWMLYEIDGEPFDLHEG